MDFAFMKLIMILKMIIFKQKNNSFFSNSTQTFPVC